MNELSSLQKILWPEIDAQIRAHAPHLAFVQTRVSAEAFLRDHAAMAAHRATRSLGFDVRMEKKVSGKVVDLLVTRRGEEPTPENSVLIELKMAWPGGLGKRVLGENVDGVARDLALLRGKPNGFALVLFFALEDAPEWAPYGPRDTGFAEGKKLFVERLGHGDPAWEGHAFPLLSEETKGQAAILVWKA